MLKKLGWVVIALPFMIAPALAQNNNAHHYQGGPKTVVPHHMTDWAKSGATRDTPKVSNKATRKHRARRHQNGSKS